MPDIRLIPVDLIDPHPHNPRRDLGDLTELADSIMAHGVRQNLLIVPMHPDWPCEEPDYLSDGDDGREYCAVCDTNDRPSNIRYRVVIGHRRLSAARLAGLTEVPAAVDYMLTDAQQLELMLLENIQRADLSAIDYQQLLDLGVKVRAIAKATGRAEKTVTGRLRLLALPEKVREQVHTGQATLEDAAALQRFVDGTDPADKKMLDKLAAAMGTTNFKWEVQNAERTLEKRKEKAELLAACEARGIPVVPDADRGYIWHAYVPNVEYLDKVGDLPEGCVLFNEGLYRPRTTDEKTETDDQATARQRREEFDRQLLEESQTAWQLRDDFVRKVLQRKRLSRAEIDTIVEHVGPQALSSGMTVAWRLDEWLGLDAHYRSAADRRALIAEHYPDAPPAALLLLALHLATGDGRWFQASQDALTVALYRTLIALGYELSDAERARVFPEREAVCTECQHPADDHDIDEGFCCVDVPSQCDCSGLMLAEAGA